MVDINSKLYKKNMKAGTAFFARQNEELEYLLERHTDNVSSTRGIYRFYGLVDFKFNPVNLLGTYQQGLDSGYLALASDGPTPIFIPSFIKNAFDSMAIYYNVAKQHGKINPTPGTLVNLKITKGYININNTHEGYIQTYFEALTAYFNSKGLIDKIRNFNEFMEHFSDFSYRVAEEVPVTRTGFTRSVHAGVLSGGLAIQIENIDKSNEQRKVKDFYENPNFAKFTKIAEHFGFVIDRDVPWRLFADISSPRMQKFMSMEGITKESIFEKNYVKTSSLDMGILIKHAATFYNTYVIRAPQGTRPELVFNNSCVGRGSYLGSISTGTLKIKKFIRPQVNESTAILNYGRERWVKFYFKLRVLEEKINIPESTINSLLTSVLARSRQNNSIDMTLAAAYIDLEVKRRIKIEG